MSLINDIKNNIHLIASQETGIYSGLYFGEGKKIQDFNFNFAFNITDDIYEDVKFFLDNIIAKILEINFNINYAKTSRDQLGAKIVFNDVKTKNHFIVENYYFSKSENIADLENYIDDIIVQEIGNRYIINWTIPIYELNKDEIIII